MAMAAAFFAFALFASGCGWRSESAPPLKAGDPLPLVAGPALDGGADIDLASLAGRPFLLHLYASWSAPAQRALPELMAVREATKIDVVSINLDVDEEPATRHATFRGIDWPVIHTGDGWSDASVRRLGAKSMPRLILVGADGRVVDPDVASGDLRRAVDEAMAAAGR